MNRLRGQAAALVLLVLASGGCAGTRAEKGLRAEQVRGAVSFRTPGGEWKGLRDGALVVSGNEVRAAKGASVTLAESKTTVECGEAGWVTIEGPARLTLNSGQVMVTTQQSFSVADSEHGISASATKGTFRFDRGIRVGVYSGTAVVTAPGSIPVTALYELDLEGRVPEIHPYSIESTDRWDLRFLGEAIEVDRQLRAYQRGFDAAFGSEATSAGFFGRLVQRPDALSFLEPELPALVASLGGPSEILVAIICSLYLSKSGTAVEKAFDSVLQQRQMGASWGLIVQRFGLRASDILRALSLAITPVTPAPSPTRSQGGSSTPSASPTPSHSPSATPKPSPTKSKSPSPSPSPSFCDPISQLLGRCK